jgi:hypothetical protein
MASHSLFFYAGKRARLISQVTQDLVQINISFITQKEVCAIKYHHCLTQRIFHPPQ